MLRPGLRHGHERDLLQIVHKHLRHLETTGLGDLEPHDTVAIRREREVQVIVVQAFGAFANHRDLGGYEPRLISRDCVRPENELVFRRDVPKTLAEARLRARLELVRLEGQRLSEEREHRERDGDRSGRPHPCPTKGPKPPLFLKDPHPASHGPICQFEQPRPRDRRDGARQRLGRCRGGKGRRSRSAASCRSSRPSSWPSSWTRAST